MTEQLTIRQAAERCGLSIPALKRAVGRGAIPSECIDTPRGPVRLVTEQDVRAYLDSRPEWIKRREAAKR